MKQNTGLTGIAVLAFGLVLASAQAFAADVGEAASPESAVRHVAVNSDTRWIEVKEGETVQFDVNHQSFVWRFDGAKTSSEIDLNKIAPAGLLKNKVEVYIDHLPVDYRG